MYAFRTIRTIFAQTGTEYVPAAQMGFGQAGGFRHTLERKDRMKSAKLTLVKTLAVFFQNIKFCEAQSGVNFRNIVYLCHILVNALPPFWPSNLIFGEMPKDTKKPTNCKHLNKCTFYTLRFGCIFAVANTIRPQLL